MTKLPSRIKIEVFEFCGKYQAVSKYGKSSYYDTEIEAVNKCKEIIKAFRKLMAEN